MLLHIVLLQTREPLDDPRFADLARSLHALADAIAGAGSLAIGPNVTEEPLAQGYDFGFAIRFRDRDELRRYHADVAHESISATIQALAHTILVFDLAS
jgi:hypothetical protein